MARHHEWRADLEEAGLEPGEGDTDFEVQFLPRIHSLRLILVWLSKPALRDNLAHSTDAACTSFVYMPKVWIQVSSLAAGKVDQPDPGKTKCLIQAWPCPPWRFSIPQILTCLRQLLVT